MIKKLKKNKKGSHVGIIVSFTLFITAIIFLYSIVGSPIKTNKDKENSITDLKNNFFNFAKEKVVIARIYNNGSCIEFNTPDCVDDNYNSFAINYGVEVGSSISADKTSVSSFNGLSKVYYTKTSLNGSLEETGSCLEVNPDNIEIKEMIIENQILKIVNDSTNNESKVRNDLKISNSDEFSIVFFYPNSTYIGDRKRENLKDDIFARTYGIHYLSNKGIEEYGKIEFRIW